jgi:hypothetical protein
MMRSQNRDIATLRAVVDRVGRCVLIGHSQAPLWGNYQSVRSDIGRRVGIMDLPRLGLSGSSHLMFADRNSDDVAGLIRGWLDTALTELG